MNMHDLVPYAALLGAVVMFASALNTKEVIPAALYTSVHTSQPATVAATLRRPAPLYNSVVNVAGVRLPATTSQGEVLPNTLPMAVATSVPAIGVLGVVIAAAAAVLLRNKKQDQELEPMLMASITASPSSYSTGPQFQDPAFQDATIAAFPSKRAASPDEARVLWKVGGYSILDVRSDMEGADGRIRGPNKGSIDIPMFQAKSTYDSNLGRKVVTQEVNPKWLEQVTARFPKDAKLVVMCSDGNRRTRQAVDLLASQGYTNLVVMTGGYNTWDQVFDKRLGIRSRTSQATKGEWLEDPVQWGQWASLVGIAAPTSAQLPPTPSPSYIPPPQPTAPAPTPSARMTLMFQDPSFQAATIAAFPSKGVASPEEARVLWKLDGYSIVDIRSEMEGADGRIRGPNKGSIDIPLFNAKSTYDSNLGKRVVTQVVNPKWLEQMKARFPKDSKLVVMCSDGNRRSRQALSWLAAEGYRSVVTMDGGYNAWDQLFDQKLNVRSSAAQVAKAATLIDPVLWGTWAPASGAVVPPVEIPKAAPAPIAPPTPAPVAFAPAAPVSPVAPPAPPVQAAPQAPPVVPRAVSAPPPPAPAAPVAPSAPVAPAPAANFVASPAAAILFDSPEFQAATLAAFPGKGIATPVEARVLWRLGSYNILDVRSDMEGAKQGRIRRLNKGTVDIAMYQARVAIDRVTGQRVVKPVVNPQWLNQVRARVPKDAKVIVMCSDGRRRSVEALELLEADGYKNLVGMMGGFNKWDQLYDRKLVVRTPQMQAAKAATLKDPTEWGQWTEAVKGPRR